jgi:hypothetical protein
VSPATRSPRSRLWILRAALLFAWAALFTGAPRLASADAARPFQVGGAVAIRSFESRLDLNDELAAGFRLGLGMNERVSVLIDAVHTTPIRKTTGRLAHVTDLRSLVQVRLLTGSLRPYLVGGVGGILFDFDDAYDTAMGALTGGAGLEWRASSQFTVFGEGSLDFYRNRSVTFDSLGNEISSTKSTTDQARTYSLGLLANF